ncbi:MAG: preprotein translocase subunit SecY, partial [Candidatus Marinimicrobia bacterium]|nr:preprotein translocase subunit SecY [Candidatus Neomarinimicrobiota bacterium]
MIEKLHAIMKIPELRKRITFTLLILIAYRVGGHIPVPGIDSQALAIAVGSLQNTLFGLYDMFAGGAFAKATIFALGIMPYITASIIIQLLGAVIPYFQKLQKEGEEGRKKITQITRYGTVAISTVQSYGIAIYLMGLRTGSGPDSVQVVPGEPGASFILMSMLTLVTGTIVIMWLGELITERGIGNGISLIIMVGILAGFPNVVLIEVGLVREEVRGIFTEVVLMGLMYLIVSFVVLLTQGTRKIPVQYAKRVVGRKLYGGQSTHIPLKVNTAGVMPIIFAQSIMFVPSTIATLFPNIEWLQDYFLRYFSYDHPFYWSVFGLMIVFVT